MKVFVTGGTGFVGREVVSTLRAKGHSVALLVRRGRSDSAPPEGISQCVGDISLPETLPSCIRGAEAVIHLVGIISEVGNSTFENIHTQGTKNVIKAAKEAGVRRFVHMSALGTRPDAASRYHRTKWLAEETVRSSGLDYTLFRPSLIFGPRDHFVNLFARMMKFSPVVPVMGKPGTLFQPVHVTQVAAAFVNSLEVPESIGRTLDLCGPEKLTMPDILQAIAAATDRKRFLLKVPGQIARFQAALLEHVSIVTGKAPPLNRDQLLMLSEDNIGDCTTAQQLLGLEPLPFRESIAAYLKP